MPNTSYPFNPPEVERRIIEKESELFQRQSEYIVIFDETGNVLEEAEGTTTEVGYKSDTSGLISTHYHTSDVSFSPDDVFRELQELEQRVVTDSHRYIMRQASEGELEKIFPDSPDREATYKNTFHDRFWEEHNRESATVLAGLGVTDPNADIVKEEICKRRHDIWQRVAREVGAHYVRLPRTESP